MAFLPAGVGGIGSILSAAGSVLTGVLGFMQYQQQAKIARMNQEIANENATRAQKRSQIEAQDQDALTAAMLGEQLAKQSASGLSITGRSQSLARKSAAELGRKDALNVIQAGEVEAFNYKVQAANFGAEASAAKASGFGRLLGGFLKGGVSLAGGATGMRNPFKKSSDPWYGYRRSLVT